MRVFIICGNRLYEEALSQFLTLDARLAVVGSAGNWKEGLTQIEALPGAPDAVLVDLDFSAAVRGAKELIAANPKTALIVLHVSENEEEIAGWAEVGVSGFLSRQASVDDLVRTVESAAHGETVCPPSVAAVLLRRVTALADQLRRAGERQSSLTAREHEIVQLIDEGLSNKAIAHRLQIELPTVKNHVHHILQKLDANGRGQAAAMLRGEEAADR